MAMYNLGDVGASARTQKVQADLLTFKELLAEYQLDNGTLPTSDQGVKIFWARPATDPPPHWRALLDQETLDPWGHPYQYLNRAGTTRQVRCLVDGPRREDRYGRRPRQLESSRLDLALISMNRGWKRNAAPRGLVSSRRGGPPSPSSRSASSCSS